MHVFFLHFSLNSSNVVSERVLGDACQILVFLMIIVISVLFNLLVVTILLIKYSKTLQKISNGDRMLSNGNGTTKGNTPPGGIRAPRAVRGGGKSRPGLRAKRAAKTNRF